jgi:transposase
MDAPLDLYNTSRAELAELILAQRDRIADLERDVARQQDENATLRATVAQLTAQVGDVLAALGAGEEPPDPPVRPRGMPGLKATCAPPPATERRRRGRGYGRSRLTPTHRQVHAVARCPLCREPLTGGTVTRTREVIEVPRVPTIVTEHGSLARRCPSCHHRWVPGPELHGAVVGQGRLGVGRLSLIATLREELRLPVARIQWYLRTRHGLDLSVGAIVGACATVAARGQATIAQLQAAIRASPVVHVDETGWRENGRNGYVWTFSTPQQRCFGHGGRDKGMLRAALGEAFAGVVGSDCSGGYTCDEGQHQDCWAHLLREADDLATHHRQHPAVVGWAAALHARSARARAFADPEPAARRQAQHRFAAEARALGAPYLGVAEAPQRALCERIERHLAELFGFVADPQVPPTNNAAERSLRHLVTCRKISGGTRGADGTATKMALATLFGTWRLHGLNPLDQCRQLLASPQV